jgi:very-short-patch-repair endonuclease
MANLAARQYGIVTRDQLTELGYTDRMIDHYLRTGRLQAWHRNVLAVGHGGLSPHGLCMAAVMFRGKGALISHQSAIWLWGLEKRLEVPVNVSVRWRGHSQSSIGLHHCPALRNEDAATAKTYRLEGEIDRADRMELLDPAAVDRITEEIRGHHGRRPLQQAMTIYREAGFTRSGGEKRLLAALADAGVRRPLVNNFIEGYELDFFWEQERFAVELDSWEHHRSRRSFETDRERQEELSMAGIETIRITGTRLKHEPRQVANRIAEHLARRRLGRAA